MFWINITLWIERAMIYRLFTSQRSLEIEGAIKEFRGFEAILFLYIELRRCPKMYKQIDLGNWFAHSFCKLYVYKQIWFETQKFLNCPPLNYMIFVIGRNRGSLQMVNINLRPWYKHNLEHHIAYLPNSQRVQGSSWSILRGYIYQQKCIKLWYQNVY